MFIFPPLLHSVDDHIHPLACTQQQQETPSSSEVLFLLTIASIIKASSEKFELLNDWKRNCRLVYTVKKMLVRLK